MSNESITTQRCWAHFSNPENPEGPYLDCQSMADAGRFMNKYTGQFLYACLDHAAMLTSSWIHAPEMLRD